MTVAAPSRLVIALATLVKFIGRASTVSRFETEHIPPTSLRNHRNHRVQRIRAA